MKIGRLILQDFRGIHEMDLQLNDRLTVLAGINGSGKSAVLDALAILLSWIVARVRSPRGSGRHIRELDIRNSESATQIGAEAGFVEDDKPEWLISWQLARTRPGRLAGSAYTELREISDYAGNLRETITTTHEQCDLPLFAYYPVNRAVLDIPLRIRTKHEFGLMEAWDDALTGAANFRSFFEWFRMREDLENENRKYLDQFDNFRPDNWEFPDSRLEAVRKALESFLPEFKDFAVRRSPLRMTVLKHDEEVRVDQLSDGEKCMIALIGDLARRLAIANPVRDNPLEGEGMVLIDEVDLHLHPWWQRMVLPRMLKTFPNLQFVVSTHSPQVLGEVSAKSIRMLVQDEDKQITCYQPKQSEGLTSNSILDELMLPPNGPQTLARKGAIDKKIGEVFRLIDEERLEDAKTAIDALEEQLHGDIPDLVEAKTLIAMLKSDMGDQGGNAQYPEDERAP